MSFILTKRALDKKGNTANLLDFEAKQSRQKASQVMEKIMKNTASEKKVSLSCLNPFFNNIHHN